MDFHLKQWRDQQQQQQGKSEPTEEPNQQQQQQQHQQQSSSVSSYVSAKIPKLHLDSSPYSQSTPTLPLFVPEEGGGRQHQLHQQEEQESAHNLSKFTNLPSPFTSSKNNNNSSNSMGSYFSWAQWQELELQALIYRYMMAGAAVPPELLQPIKKSLLLHSSPYFLHSSPQYSASPALLCSGYWGRASMDPEPGRCRRTDGKKWRCSRDVVAGQKYCERHMHRGRNRSRKPVEIAAVATSTAAVPAGIFKPAGSITTAGSSTLSAVAGGGGGSHFSLSGSSPSSSIDLFHPDQRNSSEAKAQNQVGGPTDGHILRHFFDDWPRTIQESDNAGGIHNSSNSLSMSDVSLKLSTGNGGDELSRNPDRGQSQVPTSTWAAGWGPNHVASMGGPLAEALRSSSAMVRSSPTSVLHHLARSSASEASFISN